MNFRALKTRLLLVSFVVFVADLATKAWVVSAVAPFERVTVIEGFLNLTRVSNPGVAFGLFNELGDSGALILGAAGAVALAIVAVYFAKTPDSDRLLLVSLSLILGGALGNLVDRIRHGAVTDFVDAYYGTHHWHTFNLADSAISVGIGLMLLDLFLERRREPKS